MEDQSLIKNGCTPEAGASTFSPPLEYINTSKASPDLVLWSPLDLKCPPGFKINWYGLDGKHNILILEEDGVRIRWREQLYKYTKDFCVELHPDEGYRAAICRPDLPNMCSSTTCINKCCADGEVLHLNTLSCISAKYTNVSLQHHSISGSPAMPPSKAMIVSLVPDCELIVLYPQTKLSHKSYLLPNGQLYRPRTGVMRDVNNYCLENFKDGSAQVALVCLGTTSKALVVKDYMQIAGVVISTIFLTLTILFHVFIPSLRDMQGLCLLCHMASLLVADSALFVTYVLTKYLTSVHCIINGLILQFSFLAAFFWLNVMCFDIWRVIRATVSCIPLTGILANDAKKFKLYLVYAWGGPSIMTFVTVVLHNLPDQPVFSNLLRPGFGKISCWFPDGLERLTYFYGIVALLFLLNMVLLGHTVLMLYQAGTAFQCFVRQVSFTAFNRHHLEMFWHRFLLFVLMALCWVTEILSWKIPPRELWFATDVLNSSQGFIVFLIFMRSEKKRELVKEAWNRVTSSVSNTARKLSRSENPGATFHVDITSSSLSVPQEHPVTLGLSQEDQGNSNE